MTEMNDQVPMVNTAYFGMGYSTDIYNNVSDDYLAMGPEAILEWETACTLLNDWLVARSRGTAPHGIPDSVTAGLEDLGIALENEGSQRWQIEDLDDLPPAPRPPQGKYNRGGSDDDRMPPPMRADTADGLSIMYVGTVVTTWDGVIYQKLGNQEWFKPGETRVYRAEEIPLPVGVVGYEGMW